MGKKIRIYESEIRRATRRKLMERYVDEDYEMRDTYSKKDFKPTPKERGVEDVFGKYGDDMDPAVVRYMRKNPDHILRRMAKLYPDIYMRHIPLQSNTELEMGDEMIGEETQMTVYDDPTKLASDLSNDKIKRDDTVGLKDAQGNIRTATFGESKKDLIKKFIKRK
jgi:hypothetical protein